ncbi:hypothetical protein DKY64_21505, partial [Stenotrophomonas maltophilia]
MLHRCHRGFGIGQVQSARAGRCQAEGNGPKQGRPRRVPALARRRPGPAPRQPVRGPRQGD